MLIKDTCETAARIMAGDLDGDLDWILQAVAARKKNLFRKGARVRLEGTKNPSYEGREGVIVKVNAKTITVGIGDFDRQWGVYESELNAPPSMVKVLS